MENTNPGQKTLNLTLTAIENRSMPTADLSVASSDGGTLIDSCCCCCCCA